MAEAFLERAAGSQLEILSVGSRNRVLDPDACFVMQEVGIDLANVSFKTMREINLERVTYSITICSCPDELCLTVGRTFRPERWQIDDPSWVTDSREARLEAFRQTRDQIQKRVEELATRMAWRLERSATKLSSRPALDRRTSAGRAAAKSMERNRRHDESLVKRDTP